MRDFLIALAFVAVALGGYTAWQTHPQWLAELTTNEIVVPAVADDDDDFEDVADAPTRRYGAPSLCGSGRRVTCIVDGDTGWLEGEKWRLTTQTGGVDAPEISKPECPAEKRIGDRARDRLRSLMSNGYYVNRDGEDRHGRTLLTVTLADGRDVGEVLIAEGLAQAWPNTGNKWCR